MAQTKNIDGLSVTCHSLEPADAYDLIPELLPVLSMALGARELVRTGAEKAQAQTQNGEGDAAPAEAADQPITDDELRLDELLASIDVDRIAQLLSKAATVLGGGKISDLIIKLMRATVIVGSKDKITHRITDRASFNLAFAGRMWSAFPVAAFAFEVTFGNFSAAVARLNARAAL
jgi:hypothetical protein